MKAVETKKTSGWTVLTMLVLVIPAVVWRGYVLSVLWAWFVVSVFEAPALSAPAASGVLLIIGFLFWRRPDDAGEDKADTEKVLEAVKNGFVMPAFTLLIAWVVRGLM